MSQPAFTYLTDLKAEVNVPENGILSRTMHNDDRTKIVLFGFAPGQELSAHTAPMPAVLYFVEGEADLTLGGESRTAQAGTMVHMAPQLEHGIRAKTNTVMLLIMMKNPR
jgi:quercetin dioxygenase-like cupin family protein